MNIVASDFEVSTHELICPAFHYSFQHTCNCAATVTVTPFLFHLVQGTLQNTHVNRILLYARTSDTLFFSVRFSSSFVILLELA